jgi:hypothetical protein
LHCSQNSWVLLWGRSEETKVIVSLHLLLSYCQPHDTRSLSSHWFIQFTYEMNDHLWRGDEITSFWQMPITVETVKLLIPQEPFPFYISLIQSVPLLHTKVYRDWLTKNIILFLLNII